MSHRPILTKKANRLRKLMRQELAAYIDPVQWVVSRGHAKTKREARELIFDGRLRSESHKVGFGEVDVIGLDGKPTKEKFITSVSADVRDKLTVVGK